MIGNRCRWSELWECDRSSHHRVTGKVDKEEVGVSRLRVGGRGGFLFPGETADPTLLVLYPRRSLQSHGFPCAVRTHVAKR